MDVNTDTLVKRHPCVCPSHVLLITRRDNFKPLELDSTQSLSRPPWSGGGGGGGLCLRLCFAANVTTRSRGPDDAESQLHLIRHMYV